MAHLTVILSVVGLALCGPSLAKDAPRQVRKPAHAVKPTTVTPSTAGNINAPSTDFSKVERADGDESGPSRGGMRPVMGAGGIGLGGGF